MNLCNIILLVLIVALFSEHIEAGRRARSRRRRRRQQQRQLEIERLERLNSPDMYVRCGYSEGFGTVIIGGRKADPGIYPWMSAIYIYYVGNDGPPSLCGGTLISPSKVMTAAHCLLGDIDILEIVLGADNLVNHTVGSIIVKATGYTIHEEFEITRSYITNDIGLITIPSIEPSDSVLPICLPSNGVDSFVGHIGTAIGYGLTGQGLPSDLMEVGLPILAQSECVNIWKQFSVDIFNEHVCATAMSKSICSGDSGGSINVRGSDGRSLVVGISSFTPRGCDGGTSVFTRVSEFLPWIHEKIPDFNT